MVTGRRDSPAPSEYDSRYRLHRLVQGKQESADKWEAQLRKGCLEFAILAALADGELYGLEIAVIIGAMGFRLRKVNGKLKVEHSIIDGVRKFLERLIEDNPEIRSVIPGVIRPVRDARGEIKVHITVETQNGWKAIALSGGARQELFISTAMTKEKLEEAFAETLSRLS